MQRVYFEGGFSVRVVFLEVAASPPRGEPTLGRRVVFEISCFLYKLPLRIGSFEADHLSGRSSFKKVALEANLPSRKVSLKANRVFRPEFPGRECSGFRSQL